MSKLLASDVLELDEAFLESIYKKLEQRITEIKKIPKFYTVSEVGGILSLTNHSIYRILKEGKLKGKKTGKKSWRISEEQLNKYLNSKNN
jgi:excisionase family DNA binding protein